MRASLLAGAVLIVAVLGMTWFVMTTSKDKYGDDSTYPVLAEFSDASGIRWKTRVQINGIDVGKIESIRHARGRDGKLTAEVKLRLLEDYEIYSNAQVRKASESLLGDYRLDLDPGGPLDRCDEFGECAAGFTCADSGSCEKSCGRTMDCPDLMECTEGQCQYTKLVTSGEGRISDVQSVSDLDEIQSQLKIVARNVAKVSESLAKALAGPEGEESVQNIVDSIESSLKSIDEGTALLTRAIDRNDERVDEIIKNIRVISDELAVTVQAGGDIKRSTENIASLTEKLDSIAESLDNMMESDTEDEASIEDTVTELNKTMTHVAEIARKIDEGEGTLGRIVNDRTISDEVEESLEDVGELIGGITRLQTEIEWRSQFEVPFGRETEQLQAAVKNIVRLRLKPKPDKYYVIELVSDPRGTSTRQIETVCNLNVNGFCSTPNPPTTQVTSTKFGDLKFSFQFAKRFYFLALRFGILESTGGVGADLFFLDDALQLRVDAFDFSRRVPGSQLEFFPRLRVALSYEIIDHVGIQAGLDDPLNGPLFTWFFGGVVTFTDEDLKLLLAVAPTP